MASKETQGSLLLVAALAGTVGFVAFVALMVLGGFGFNPAFFTALVIALVVAVILYLGFHKKPAHGNDARPGPVTGGTAPTGGTGSASTGTASSGASPASAPESAGSSAPAASAAPAAAASGTAAPAAAAAPQAAVVKPSKELSGEKDLAARKGEWKYDGDSAAPSAGAARPAPVKADPTPADQPSGTGEAAGVAPPEVSEEDKPEMMSAPREGGPDNLKEIKGVGPKLEDMLHGMGVFHFDQIAKWTERELAWVDQNLQGFKGRASRDNWVSQAKILADGGETEFSQRVDKGGVY